MRFGKKSDLKRTVKKGTFLLSLLIEEATRANKRLRHMVFVHNNEAQRFYERLGFLVIEDLGAYKHMEFRA